MANEQDPAQDSPTNPYDHQEAGEEAKFKSRPARGARRLTPEEAAKLIPGLEDVGAFQDPAAGSPHVKPRLDIGPATEAIGDPVAEVDLEDPVVVAAERSAAEISAAFEAVLARGGAVGEGGGLGDSSDDDLQAEPAFGLQTAPLSEFEQRELPRRSPKRKLLVAGLAAVLLGSSLAIVLPTEDTSELAGWLLSKSDDQPASSKQPTKNSAAPGMKGKAPTPTVASTQTQVDPLDTNQVVADTAAPDKADGFSLEQWLGERFDSGGGTPLPVEYEEPMLVLNSAAPESPALPLGPDSESIPGAEESTEFQELPALEPDAETLALLESVEADLAELEQLDGDGLLADESSDPAADPSTAVAEPDALAIGPQPAEITDPAAATAEAEANLDSRGRAERSAVLPLAEQLVMPAPLSNIARATKGDYDHIFSGLRVTPELLAGDRRMLTPAIGPVRVRLTNGEYFDGQLREAGGRQLLLATIHGSLTLDMSRVVGVDHLDPDAPLVSASAPRQGAELVRIRTRGGVIAGRVLVKDEHRVTIRLADGGEITLRNPQYIDAGVEPSSVALVGLRPPQ
jgi:hypothetical protein